MHLIRAMIFQMPDVRTGDMVKSRIVDIRSNTDENWMGGMRYIPKNTFFTGGKR